MCSRNEAQAEYWEERVRKTPAKETPPPARARVTLWTADGKVQLSSYTCPVADAYANACKDLDAEPGAGYVTVAYLGGDIGRKAYRITRVTS